MRLGLIDLILNIFCRSAYLKRKLKAFADRIALATKGYIFSYDSNENGEIDLIKHISDLCKNETFTFFDVGAHHGTYTDMILENIPQHNGHLFEPTPASFERLTCRFKSNSSLTLNNVALSNFKGESTLIIYPDDPTRNGLSGVLKELDFDCKEVKCKTITGDNYCNRQAIDRVNLLKIDAEGHDYNVIKGFVELIKNGRVDLVQFEYTFRHSDMRITLRDYFEFFTDYGYSIGPVRKHGVDFFESFDSRYNNYEFGPNYLAVRNDLTDEYRIFEK
jgi:FkbM family methyltransferase